MEGKQYPEVRVRQIVEKALVMGLTGKQLASLESVKKLAAKRHRRNALANSWLMTVACALMAVLIMVIYQWELYNLQGFAKFWLDWNDRDLQGEKCTIAMPAHISEKFRPPVNCSVCSNINDVDKVSSISKELFQERYAYTGRPVIISDGTRNWTAPQVFSFEFFRGIYADDSPALENYREDCQFFPYQTEFKSLGEVFSMNEDRANMRDGSKPWYIGWSNCDSNAFSQLRQHYSTPYFLPSDAESSKTDWIFMGCPGYGAQLHVDNVQNPSWQAQISGRKKWTLEAPIECHLECRTLETIVEPGEIIVLDTNWWYHKTLIVGDEMSITIGSEYD